MEYEYKLDDEEEKITKIKVSKDDMVISGCLFREDLINEDLKHELRELISGKAERVINDDEWVIFFHNLNRECNEYKSAYEQKLMDKKLGLVKSEIQKLDRLGEKFTSHLISMSQESKHILDKGFAPRGHPKQYRVELDDIRGQLWSLNQLVELYEFDLKRNNRINPDKDFIYGLINYLEHLLGFLPNRVVDAYSEDSAELGLVNQVFEMLRNNLEVPQEGSHDGLIRKRLEELKADKIRMDK